MQSIDPLLIIKIINRISRIQSVIPITIKEKLFPW